MTSQLASALSARLPAADRDLVVGMFEASLAAGRAIMEIASRDIVVTEKGDHSPVTLADAEAEKILLAALAKLDPSTPVIAEEQAAAGLGPTEGGEAFYLVDPLDGTKEFIARRPEFTVNVGRIEDGAPVWGIVHVPSTGVSYLGHIASKVCLKIMPDGSIEDLQVADVPAEGFRVVASRSHGSAAVEAYLADVTVSARMDFGSSLKFCVVAEGKADLYPRLAPTMEWDTAAADAVLRAAGGAVFGLDGAPLRYGKPRFFNPGFLAAGSARALAPIGPFMPQD